MPEVTNHPRIPGYKYPKRVKQQSGPKARTYTAFGQTKTMMEWAKAFHISYSSLHNHLVRDENVKGIDPVFLLEGIFRAHVQRNCLSADNYQLGDKTQSLAAWEREIGIPPGSLNGLVWWYGAFRETIHSPPIPEPAQ